MERTFIIIHRLIYQLMKHSMALLARIIDYQLELRNKIIIIIHINLYFQRIDQFHSKIQSINSSNRNKINKLDKVMLNNLNLSQLNNHHNKISNTINSMRFLNLPKQLVSKKRIHFWLRNNLLKIHFYLLPSRCSSNNNKSKRNIYLDNKINPSLIDHLWIFRILKFPRA